MFVEPKCPKCENGFVRSVEKTQLSQTVEMVEMVEGEPEVYEWGDTDVWYETARLMHYECGHCGYESKDLASFVASTEGERQ